MRIQGTSARKGFTGLELLVVVAVVVVGAALATPQIFKALKRAALAEAREGLTTLLAHGQLVGSEQFWQPREPFSRARHRLVKGQLDAVVQIARPEDVVELLRELKLLATEPQALEDVHKVGVALGDDKAGGSSAAPRPPGRRGRWPRAPGGSKLGVSTTSFVSAAGARCYSKR